MYYLFPDWFLDGISTSTNKHLLYCFVLGFFYTVGTVLFDVGDVYYEDSTCAVFSESMRLKHVLDESYC